MVRVAALLALSRLAGVGALRGQTAVLTASAGSLNATGGQLTFTFSSSFPGPPAIFTLEVALPAGWIYLGGVGEPAIKPAQNALASAGNPLSWTDISALASPIQFSFNASYPAATTAATISSAVTLRQSGGRIDVAPLPIVFSPNLAISTQPQSESVALGGSTTLRVSASGPGPFTFQWRKNGVALTGATASSLTLSSVKLSDTGSYTVAVANGAGTTTSNVGSLLVTLPPGAPVITAEPEDVSIGAGARVSFRVAASGAGTLNYEWRKNGLVLSNSAVLSLRNVQPGDAGTYTAVVSNSLGSATSRATTLAIRGVSYVGSYFGTFGEGGSFALFVRDDNSGVFIGYAAVPRTALLNRNVTVDDSGHLRAVALADLTIDATIGGDGRVTGTISGLNTTLAATRSSATGPAQSVAGYYQAGATGSSATAYAVVGPAGQAFILAITPGATVAGAGTVDAAGKFSVATANNGVVSGTLAAASSTLTASVTPTGGARIDFTGANDARTTTEKLINIATRGPVGAGAGELIAGFVITGNAPKQVLVRAIGPTLGAFGVGGALPAARLELFDGKAASIATTTAWGAASNAADITAAAARAGAFALDAASKDAVLLITLEPGAYTAVVSGDGGAAGVALVEVYDVSENASALQKVVNIASRAFAGSGASTLTAGFVINGIVPKRLLVRGAGPALAAFGVGGALVDPQLKLFSQQTNTVIATNDNWGDTADATAIANAAGGVGAFAFNPGSKDAALLLNLDPGAYTVQLSGAGSSTGTALIEVYEVP